MAVPVISAVQPSTVTNGAATVFTVTASETPTSWAWTFGSPAAWGSPATSTDEAPSVIPTGSGILTGVVTATNGDGTSDPYFFAVTVVDAVQAAPLVRLSVLKEHIKSTGASEEVMARFTRYARQATQLLELYCGRVLVRPPVALVMPCDGTGRALLPAREWPLTAATIATVQVGSVEAAALDPGEWAVDVVQRRSVLRRVGGVWPLGTGNIFITGQPGYDTTGWDSAAVDAPFGVPAHLEQAVMEQCAMYAKRFQTTATETVTVDQAGNRTISRTADVRDLVPAMRQVIQMERRGGGA